MARAFNDALRNSARKDALRQEQRNAWSWREQNCQDKTCLTIWFNDRIAALQPPAQDQRTASKAAPSSPAKSAPRPHITPTEIAKAYLENSIAADRRFKGQPFEVKARVASIGIDDQRQPYLGLYTNLPGSFVKAEVSSSETDMLASLKRMDVVLMHCVGAGLDTTRTTPILDCGNVSRQETEGRGAAGPTRIPYESNLGAMP
jgi:uncharacterized protein